MNNFSKDYWEKTNSLIEFQPSRVLLPNLPITAVKLFDIHDGQLMLVAIPTGWDVPGGHIEAGETAAEALKREIQEETGGNISQPKLIGLLCITNQRVNQYNANYPTRSAIAIYKGVIADITHDSSLLTHETIAIDRFDVDRLAEVLPNWSRLSQEIVDYIVTSKD